MTSITHKKILLIITGGIAAYKSADLLRQLKKSGAELRVIMTQSAQTFVTPLTFQALSGYPVLTDWRQQESDYAMDHIAVARWADIILIAPATADFMARLAHGLADDVATTLCLATDVPILLAPAMNQQMWQNAATQANYELLQKRKYTFIGPAEGEQACGELGFGRMEEPENIVLALEKFFGKNQPLAGITVLITAGPTQEPIDPVRFISNHSSGKMGYAVAEAAINLGAKVILVSGPTFLKPPRGVQCFNVITAQEMYETVMEHVASCQIFIAVAAVGDYRVSLPQTKKMKKTGQSLTLNLQENPDIVATVAGLKNRPFIVGFAAETDNLEAHAQSKLQSKKLDMIAANLVAAAEGGFAAEDNALLLLWPQGRQVFSLRGKQQLAEDLWQQIIQCYGAMQK